MDEHFEWMLITGYSAVTVHNRRHAIRRFIAWADERGLGDPREITRPSLERYQRHLFYYRKDDGSPMSTTMQRQCLAALKTWFKWLSRQNHIPANPAADIDLPRTPQTPAKLGAERRRSPSHPARSRTAKPARHQRPGLAGNPLRHWLKTHGAAEGGDLRRRPRQGRPLG